jgi:hypothetical protein
MSSLETIESGNIESGREGRMEMDWLASEPELNEILDDPIIEAVMARDGVERDDLRTLLNDVGRALCREKPRWPRRPSG